MPFFSFFYSVWAFSIWITKTCCLSLLPFLRISVNCQFSSLIVSRNCWFSSSFFIFHSNGLFTWSTTSDFFIYIKIANEDNPGDVEDGGYDCDDARLTLCVWRMGIDVLSKFFNIFKNRPNMIKFETFLAIITCANIVLAHYNWQIGVNVMLSYSIIWH